jgi:predicted metalloprotease with PDZ domain
MRSFMFGYSDEKVPEFSELHGLLAHEITRNWPQLEGDHGDTAWYSEGNAEYYSVLLSCRAGVYDDAKFLKVINARASGYYTNPLRSLSNQQAAENIWSDSAAQRVPYGRGFMYLASVDAEIREKSGGKRSLDDLVLEILQRQRKQDKYGISEWLDLVTRELDPAARDEFQKMTSGAMLVPPPNSFAPCFAPTKFADEVFELGFAQASLAGDRKVRGLVEGSAAAAAGVHNDDLILESSRLADVQDDPTQPMRLKIRRGDEELTISYLPRGALVPSYHWVRVNNVPLSACKL